MNLLKQHFELSDKINGNGTLNYSNSKGKYEGTFNDGLREGTGTLFYDGNKYVGKLLFSAFCFKFMAIM